MNRYESLRGIPLQWDSVAISILDTGSLLDACKDESDKGQVMPAGIAGIQKAGIIRPCSDNYKNI